MHTIIQVLAHIEVLFNFADTRHCRKKIKKGKVHIFIFKIGNNYVIGCNSLQCRSQIFIHCEIIIWEWKLKTKFFSVFILERS